MELNCLIVDDEPLALDLMESYVKRTPFLKLVARCSNALEVLQVLREEAVDLIFLDIQMPELNGLELSRVLDKQIKVIFTTAFEQYALEGFRVDALDYLLKPVSYPEFLKAANKALNWFEKNREMQGACLEEDCIFVKSDYKLVKVENLLYRGFERLCKNIPRRGDFAYRFSYQYEIPRRDVAGFFLPGTPFFYRQSESDHCHRAKPDRFRKDLYSDSRFLER